MWRRIAADLRFCRVARWLCTLHCCASAGGVAVAITAVGELRRLSLVGEPPHVRYAMLCWTSHMRPEKLRQLWRVGCNVPTTSCTPRNTCHMSNELVQQRHELVHGNHSCLRVCCVERRDVWKEHLGFSQPVHHPISCQRSTW